MPRNLFTPSNVRPRLPNTVPSVPRWTILPPTPSASSDLSPTPCPKEKKKSLRRKRKGMKVIPPTPEFESDQEIDELEYSPLPQVVQPPPPPPNPSRKRKRKTASTSTSNTQAIPSTQPTPNLEDESCAVQAALLKVIGTSHLTVTDEQKEFINLVSKVGLPLSALLPFLTFSSIQDGSEGGSEDRPDASAKQPTWSPSFRSYKLALVRPFTRHRGMIEGLFFYSVSYTPPPCRRTY